MKYKICSKCGLNKSVEEYLKASNQKSGLRPECKDCQKAYRSSPETAKRIKDYAKLNKQQLKIYAKEYRQKNKSALAKYFSEYSKANKKLRNEYFARYRTTNKFQSYQKQWRCREDVKEKRRVKDRERRKNDIGYRISKDFSRYMQHCLRSVGGKGGLSWKKLVDYTLDELKSHLEKQFRDGMTWENKGKVWHIDHIKPISSFDITSKDCDAFRACWSLSNLRPLLVQENLRKGNR